MFFFLGEIMKEKNILNLCFKYNSSCKKCPRNAKCQKELEIEQHNKKEGDRCERLSNKNNNYMCNNTDNTFWKKRQ